MAQNLSPAREAGVRKAIANHLLSQGCSFSAACLAPAMFAAPVLLAFRTFSASCLVVPIKPVK
jgi:hypothetical protein